MRILILLLTMSCLTACGAIGFPGVYRINVEQGNIVTEEMVNQLKAGMSKRQVRFIMGTPLLEDTFDQKRWEYTYAMRNGTEIISRATTTVFFDGDSLVDVSGDLVPAWAQSTGGAESDDAAASDADETDASSD